ncbi:MAG TPA: YciI family protein [Planctomycetaceae bacterium]|nr:YciI family protein [Planctomycetaceae bacterium]
MRFISVNTLNPTNRLPTEAEIASMQKFIVEGMKAGWLIECEGVTFGTTGVRVHRAADGKVTVSDGPFAETKEILGGYALLNAASKAEAVQHTRRFLEHIGEETSDGTWEGTWEIYQLYEMPTEEGQ